MTKFRRTALGAVAVLALSGCGGSAAPAVKTLPVQVVTVTEPVPVATAEITPGPAAYLAWAASAPFIQTKFLPSEKTEANLLGVGRVLCKSEPWDFETAVFLLTSGGENSPSQVEAEEMVKQVVTNLCPENVGYLP